MLVNIVYASTSGNTEAVCEKIAQILKAQSYDVSLFRSEQSDISILNQTDLFIFATSTWEHGVLNPFFNSFYEAMNTIDLNGKSAGFVGLGDIRYEKVLFCRGIDIVKEKFLERGGSEINQTLKINGEPYGVLDTTVSQWAEDFINSINNGR